MKGKVFSIVIPAYNEEDAIEAILTSCLAAREPLMRETGLARVEVVTVDDGSRDRTRELVGRFPEVKLVVHPKNRGYGRALMTGFEAASGDYLGFLDADGTCDPLAFKGLLAGLAAAGADMAVGMRLHAGSKMPKIRALGNRIYAAMITSLTGVVVTDSASGMRVFRKDLLPRLSPLPSGLHFTPAMTASAACLGARIVELPIPYADRQGESKLNVVADGLRFLRVILGTIFAFFPLRVFGPLGLLFAAAAAAYGLKPVAYYVAHGRLEEDMIYRLLTICTLTVCGLTAVVFGLLAQRVADLMMRRTSSWAGPRLRGAALGAGIALGLGGIVLNSRVILEYVSSGRIASHWSYVLTGGLAVVCGTMLACFAVVLGLVGHLPGAKGDA